MGVKEETTFGTAATVDKYIDIVSEDLKSDRGTIFPETVDSRYQKKQVAGANIVRGTVNFVVEPENVAHLFKWTLGSVTSVQQGTTTVYDHTFKPADDIKSFTVEIGLDSYGRVIKGCLVNRLTLESVAKKQLVGSVEVVGREEVKLASPGTPTFSGLRPFVWSDASFTIAGADKKSQLKAFRLNVANNIPVDELYGHGSSLLQRIEVAGLDVEGNLDLSHVDSAQFDNFLAGNAVALNLKFTGEATGVAEYPNYTLEVDLPNCVYLSDAVPHLDRKEPLKSNVPFRALYDPTAGYVLKIVVRNKVTAY